MFGISTIGSNPPHERYHKVCILICIESQNTYLCGQKPKQVTLRKTIVVVRSPLNIFSLLYLKWDVFPIGGPSFRRRITTI